MRKTVVLSSETLPVALLEKGELRFIDEAVKRQICDFEDRLFEKIYDLELDGIILKVALDPQNAKNLCHANAYHAVWSRNLRELFLTVKHLGFKPSTFVDIGSGKGKACFYAHLKKLFDTIIGVEFSAGLVDVANQNKAKLGASNISFLNMDATQYQLPDQPSMIFLFNPFDDVVMEQFLLANRRHFQKHGSVVAYANDIHRVVLKDHGFDCLFRNSERKISLHSFSHGRSRH